MAVTYVRAAFGSGSFSATCDASIDLTGIDTLLVWAWTNANGGATNISSAAVDPAGANTAMTAGTQRSGSTVLDTAGNLRGFAVSGLALSGTKTVRVTFSNGDTNTRTWVVGYTGGTAVSASVLHDATSGSVTSTAVGSASGDTVVGFFAQNGVDSTWTPTSPTAIVRSVLTSDTAYITGVVWEEAGAASVTLEGTVSPGFHWVAESWNITGSSGTDYTLTADQGSYALTGQSANLLSGRAVIAAQGSYSLAGQDVTLTKETPGQFVMTADGGTYSWVGEDALADYAMNADGGAYSLAGQDVSFTRTLPQAYSMSAEGGVYTWAGKSARLVWSGEPPNLSKTTNIAMSLKMGL